jgi:hypothetical protein
VGPASTTTWKKEREGGGGRERGREREEEEWYEKEERGEPFDLDRMAEIRRLKGCLFSYACKIATP